MPTIFKTSVREEVERLRNEFEQPGSEGKAASEIHVLTNSIPVIVELIL